jgi:gliding motility-associated-like protein
LFVGYYCSIFEFGEIGDYDMIRIHYILTVVLLCTMLYSGTAKAEKPVQSTATLSSPDSLNSAMEKQLNIIVSRLLSPNGDGVNDYWHIQGIDKYPDNKVVIFNRWGDKVEVIKNYDNQSNRWEGKDEKGHMVPDGTYYYMLELSKERKTLNGWVYLVQ